MPKTSPALWYLRYLKILTIHARAAHTHTCIQMTDRTAYVTCLLMASNQKVNFERKPPNKEGKLINSLNSVFINFFLISTNNKQRTCLTLAIQCKRSFANKQKKHGFLVKNGEKIHLLNGKEE